MYVYLIRSLSHPDQRYVGLTQDLKRHIAQHNAGKTRSTRSHRPWETVVAIYFADPANAQAFERYLNHGSGHTFANRHFW